MLVLLPVLASACADRPAGEAQVHPLRGSDRSEGTIADAVPTTTGPTVTADGAATTDTPTDTPVPAPGPASADATLAVVQSVLDGYDTVLTTVAADPLGASTQGNPALDAWYAVVQPTSSFSVTMLTELRERAMLESTVVAPGPDGFAYRHHVLRTEDHPVSTGSGTTVSFTWCGHSPGIGIDTTSGAVVDDVVAVSNGTGELIDEGAGWRLATLDTADIVIEAPGTPDPCPEQVAAATRAG